MLKINKKLKKTTFVLILGYFVVSQSAPVIASQISPDAVIKMVNDSREANGLLPLQENATLDKVAQDKANDMVAKKYFAHNSPEGTTPWHWYEKEKYDYVYAGENLAINYMTAEDEHQAWMNSPTHRKNILNPNYQEIGVAVAAGEITGDETSIIAVQEFGTLMGAVPAKKIESAGKDLKADSELLKPTVLSVKDTMSDKNLRASQPEGQNNNMLFKFSGDKNQLAEFGYDFALFLFILSVMVAPMVVAFYSIEKLIKIVSIKTKIKIKAA